MNRGGNAAAQAAGPSAGDLVAGIYDLVSSTGGKLPDWNKVRDCFLKEAVVILRTSRTATTVFSLDGFIKDFVDFYERPFKTAEGPVLPKEKGFRERVIRMKAWAYGEMAHVLVHYEAQILGISRPPQQGIDSWLLVRREGRWFVAAITNEIVTADRPVPPELRADASGGTQDETPPALKERLGQATKSGDRVRAAALAGQLVEATEQEH